jgi:catechol 2,3-dioxygenase-like lactoylglutathione lyase family enzyme
MVGRAMQQQISVITLGIADVARSKYFYGEGFGWSPVFESDEIVFYQMNGLMLGIWLKDKLAEDSLRPDPVVGGGFALAHNVGSPQEVDALIARLAAHGGKALRPGDSPPHGGYRGYVADPDGHAWEVAFNPAWAIDEEGHVNFGI